MARGRGGTDEVLAVHLARRYQLRGIGRPHQTSLADRAGLSGPQAGSWAGPLRRTWLARVTPPHNPLYRGVWLPDRRTGDFSPLRTLKSRNTRDGFRFPGHRSGGTTAASRAAHSEFHCHAQTAAYHRAGQTSAALPLLRHTEWYESAIEYMTQ